ncbi:phage tail tape measure protein, partial [Streptococcus suis]
DLRAGIRNMAKEIPASTTEISAVAEAAGQLGIKTENVLDFTRVMIDMGQSTNLSAEEAANSMARLANITQMPQDKFDELGSTIVSLGNNFATTESEILEMGLRLAGTGNLVGLTEAQIMGLA